MRLFITLSLLVTSFSVYAIPNVWTSGWGQGFAEYQINDTKGTNLLISCNFSAGDQYDHSVTLAVKKNEYSNSDSSYPLEFLFDDAVAASPPGTTNWRNGANAWSEFAAGIAKAKKIDVFLNGKKIATFNPPLGNIKSVAKKISTCSPMF